MSPRAPNVTVHFLDEDFYFPICGRPRGADWCLTSDRAEVRCSRCSRILDRERRELAAATRPAADS